MHEPPHGHHPQCDIIGRRTYLTSRAQGVTKSLGEEGRLVAGNMKHRRSMVCGRLTVWTAVLALAAQMLLTSMMAVARAGTDASEKAAGPVICTSHGLKRITPADRGSNADPSVPRSDTPCPICLAPQSPGFEPSPPVGSIDLAVIPVAFDGDEAVLRALGRSGEPPARGPPPSA